MKIKRPIIHLVVIIVIGVLTISSPQLLMAQEQSNIGVIKKNGMVVSAHELASNVGRDILLKGGNAFDAAAAVHFALTVVYPQAGNIGGGGFAVFHTESGDNGALDFREKAPLAATKDMYLDDNQEIVKGKSTLGHLAVGVPGSVDGIIQLHEKYGILPFKKIIQPAIDLAYFGHAINAQLANDLNRFQEAFASVNDRQTIYNKKTPWKTGDHHINQPLTATLILIRDKGRNGFYKGIIADMIVKESNAGHGIITYQDLMDYNSVWRVPTKGIRDMKSLPCRHHRVVELH